MNGTVKSGCAEIVATEKKIILILLGFVIAFSFKCGTRYDPSVNRYSYLYKVDKEKYLSDSTYFVFQINDLIKQKQDPFYTGEFDSLTEIFIDTILYNDKHDKFAFFAITKNSNDKFLKRGSATEFHFDGFFFIGSLLNGSSQIKWVRVLSYSRFKQYEDISHKIKYWYNNNLDKVPGKNNESLFKYNINDLRFWNSPIWDSTYLMSIPESYITGTAN